jgi:predicted nucleotidyltransferase
MTRREVPLDATAILKILSEHGVDFVVIGGVAVQAHGHTRTTQDLDVFPEPSRENRRRLASALAALNARRVGDKTGRAAELRVPARGILELDTDAGGIDLHLAPAGAAAYEDVRRRALEIEVAAIRLRVAGLDDLISMKRASGRPIDRGDIIALTESRR